MEGEVRKLGQKGLFLLLLAFFMFGMIAELSPLAVGVGAGAIAVLVMREFGDDGKGSV